ncbi:MAG: YIP1 family protein [Gemmatimonadota bacterium]
MTTVRPEAAPLLARIRDTFLSPSRLAAHIRANAPWLDVLLITTVIAALSVATLPDEVFTEPMREAVSRRGEPVQITSAPEVIARWGRLIAMLATIGTHPVMVFTIAGLFTLLFSIVGQGGTSFRDFLSLVSHAMLIPALGTLLVTTLRLGYAATTGSFELVELFGPMQTSGLPMAIVTSLDPFIVWMLVAAAVAIRELEPRHSVRAAAAILVAGYLALVVASTYLLHPELRSRGTTEDSVVSSAGTRPVKPTSYTHRTYSPGG